MFLLFAFFASACFIYIKVVRGLFGTIVIPTLVVVNIDQNNGKFALLALLYLFYLHTLIQIVTKKPCVTFLVYYKIFAGAPDARHGPLRP